MSGQTRQPDVLVVGGGPAGLAAATEAARGGAHVVVVERDRLAGGILNQCIHDGFGLTLFGESLTGPEYASRQIDEVEKLAVEFLLEATVLSIGLDKTCEILSPAGYELLRPGSIVLAMGCRERSFGSLAIPGSRPAGIYGAGAAQRLINLQGVMVGRKALILGSGDIGLIMARRLVLEGAEVACVVERLAYAGGLPRNVSQCVNDFEIPLFLEHTVVEVLGRKRLEGARIARVDESGSPVPGTDRVVECDTLLTSVGLLPENELTRLAGAQMDARSAGPVVDQRLATSLEGVFACGNVLHVHDLADWASLEGGRAGKWAARYASEPWAPAPVIDVRAGAGLRYVVPQRLVAGEPAVLHFRASEPCRRARIVVTAGGRELACRLFDYLAPAELATIDVPALGDGVAEVVVGLE